MANDFLVKVDPSVLKDRASEFSGMVKTLREDFSGLQEIVFRTRYYWIGQAGDQYRKGFNSKKGTVDTTLQRLDKYPQDLLQMAGIYEQTETANRTGAGSLETNFIE